jgi:drug/metabolite transporter (DMT)-like permease
MNILGLYTVTVLIWGTTWLGIKFQLGVVPPTISVVYRFLLASFILFLYCRFKGIDLKLSKSQHVRVLILGLLMFSINYICSYSSSMYLASGIVAIVSSTAPIVNIINSWIFFGEKLQPKLIGGASMGLVGILLVFFHDFANMHLSNAALLGLSLALVATIISSFGNMISVSNYKNGLHIAPSNTYGMFYGAILTLLFGLIRGDRPTFEFSTGYVVSLLYLSVFGSIFAFGAYFTLVKRIGPSRASYAGVLFPIIALILSTLFENFHWDAMSLGGVVLILGGNVFIMQNRPTAKAAANGAAPPLAPLQSLSR